MCKFTRKECTHSYTLFSVDLKLTQTLCNMFAYVKQENMVDSHPLGIHTGFDDNSRDIFVVLKYRIDCML